MEPREADSDVEQIQNRNGDGGDGEDDDVNSVPREDIGKMLYGCEHYRRRCKIRAPCCDKIFACRHCHNETTSALSNPKERHELVRHDVKQVVCAVCDTEQQVAKLCSNCGVKFGEYFCDICKFYDDDITKEQFHCGDCGICRVGGRENYFHCPKCGSCYSTSLRNNHLCVEDSMKSHCPICYEFLFDSTKQTSILKCGHTMHVECYQEMFSQNQYRCPICFKSVLNMSSTWERIDREVFCYLLSAHSVLHIPFLFSFRFVVVGGDGACMLPCRCVYVCSALRIYYLFIRTACKNEPITFFLDYIIFMT